VVRSPRLWEALVPVVLLILLLGLSVVNIREIPQMPVLTPILEFLSRLPLLGSLVESGISPHIPLVFGTVISGLISLRLGYTWNEMQRGITDGILVALPACLILLVIGMLIATWITSGIVPTMIYYGLKLISPGVFLPATCIICSLVSLSTGSSWSTAGTVGIALIGVGHGLGFPLPIVAGAIISGAYFGDKISPLSDTTNLAPGVAGTDVFGHVRHMVFTTLPSFVIALALYTFIGLRHGENQITSIEDIDTILVTLEAHYHISAWLLLPPILVIAMVVFRGPALPALLLGAFIGGIVALAAQGASLAAVIDAAQNGIVSQTGVAAVDELLGRGGMESMLSTVALIICALAFGGLMERTGMLSVIAGNILKAVHSTGSLVASTVATSIGMNFIAPDQYLSIVVPGRMYREAFQRQNLHLKNLSRCLEDGGTLTSPLVPWNTCGAYMWATLGVFPFAYLPFAFLNLINPIISVIYGYTGITMAKLDDDNGEGLQPSQSETAI
jgi:NhaC family Na+:H+ antiporter